MVKKYFVCSDIHDDIDALNAFVDFSQTNEADHMLLLGDFSLRPREYPFQIFNIIVHDRFLSDRILQIVS